MKTSANTQKTGAPRPKSQVRFVLSALYFLAAFLLVMHYIVAVSPVLYHADDADTILWAKAAFDSGRLLDPDFIYACFLPFGGQLLMLPFLGLFGFTIDAHLWGMGLFAALFAGGLLFLFRSFRFSYQKSFLAAGSVLLCLLASPTIRDIFWGHVIYYSLGSLFFLLGLGMVCRYLDPDKAREGGMSRREWLLAAALFLFTACCATDGITTIALFLVPCFCGVFLERLLDRACEKPFDKKTVILLAAMAAGFVLGFLAMLLMTRGMEAAYSEGYSEILAGTEWIESAPKFFLHWIYMFGAEGSGNVPILSRTGVERMIQLGMAFAVGIVPIVALVRYNRQTSRITRIVTLANGVLAAVLLFGYVFGALSVAKWRISPLVVTSLVSSFVWLNEAVRRADFAGKRIVALLAVLLILGVGSYGIRTLQLPNRKTKESGWRDLAEYLAGEGLTYGYADFWDAAPITLFSEGRVQVYNIRTGDGAVVPYAYQTNLACYEDQPGQARYFVLLSEHDYDNLAEAQSDLIEKATTLRHNGSVILVTEENPVERGGETVGRESVGQSAD